LKEANKKILRNSKFLKETIEELCSYRLNEKAHSFPTYGPISIGESVERSLDSFKSNRGKNAAITLLSVILAANRNYNKVVEPNIKRIKKEYPKLKSLEDLQELIKKMSKREFFSFWGHKDKKKYATLKLVLNAYSELKKIYSAKNSFSIMRKWAENADVEHLSDDIIGRIPNIGIATFQHLRMAYGVDTVKPDLRVKQVLREKFGFQKVTDKSAIRIVEEMSKNTRWSVFELDQIFVRYGSGYIDGGKKIEFPNQFDQKNIIRRLLAEGVKTDVIGRVFEMNVDVIESM
jgi:hypothetical protein